MRSPRVGETPVPLEGDDESRVGTDDTTCSASPSLSSALSRTQAERERREAHRPFTPTGPVPTRSHLRPRQDSSVPSGEMSPSSSSLTLVSLELPYRPDENRLDMGLTQAITPSPPRPPLATQEAMNVRNIVMAQDSIMRHDPIMRHILPFVLSGTAITVVSGGDMRRFAPPTPPQQNASQALRANYRAAMQAFLEVIHVHILGSLPNGLLHNVEPHYEEPPLVGDDLKQLQRRVLRPSLGAAMNAHDAVCTVCMEDFADADDSSDSECVKRDIGTSPLVSTSHKTRRQPDNVLLTQHKSGEWDSIATMKTSSRMENPQPGAPPRTTLLTSDPESVLEAAEREGKRIVCRLPCNHFFCYDCAKRWFAQTGACPNCRARLRPLAESYAREPPAPTWWCRREPIAVADAVSILVDRQATPPRSESPAVVSEDRLAAYEAMMGTDAHSKDQDDHEDRRSASRTSVADMYAYRAVATPPILERAAGGADVVVSGPLRAPVPPTSVSPYSSYDWGFHLPGAAQPVAGDVSPVRAPPRLHFSIPTGQSGEPVMVPAPPPARGASPGLSGDTVSTTATAGHVRHRYAFRERLVPDRLLLSETDTSEGSDDDHSYVDTPPPPRSVHTSSEPSLGTFPHLAPHPPVAAPAHTRAGHRPQAAAANTRTHNSPAASPSLFPPIQLQRRSGPSRRVPYASRQQGETHGASPPPASPPHVSHGRRSLPVVMARSSAADTSLSPPSSLTLEL